MPKRRADGPLTTEQLADLAEASLGNAVVLLADARRLLETGSLPLAYSVAIIAAEEFGKCQLAVGAIGSAEDPGIDYWKEFWATFYGHGPKLARMAHFATAWLSAEMVESFIETLEPALTEQRREKGFYVDVTQGRVVAPDEEITEAETSALLQTFGDVISSYAAIFDQANPLGTAFLAATSQAELMRAALETRDPNRIREAWETTTGRRLTEDEVQALVRQLVDDPPSDSA